MDFETKRSRFATMLEAQHGNRAWWILQQMRYDWKDKIRAENFSIAWFDAVDRRFLWGPQLFPSAENPFEEFMGTAELAGKRVLEIGCGMGLQAEMLARAGAVLTAVDISDVSVAAARQRLDLKHLSADLLRLDAETLPFGDATFDPVWSWGAIHPSAHTGRIVKQIARVLKPGVTAKLMVYNVGRTATYVTLMLRHSWAFWLKRRSLDETLWASSDGFMSRFYTKDLFMDCLSTLFTHVDIGVLGQEADAIPLPRALRGWVRRWISEAALRRLASERAAFLYAMART